MSSLEVFGILLGIVGPLAQARQAAHDLKHLFNAYRQNGRALTNLVEAYEAIIEHFQSIYEQFQGKTYRLAPYNCAIFETDLIRAQNTLETAVRVLSELHAAHTAKTRLFRLLNASKVHRTCVLLEAEARDVHACIAGINGFLSTLAVVEGTAAAQTDALVNELRYTSTCHMAALSAAFARVSTYIDPRVHAVSRPSEIFRSCFRIEHLRSYNWLAYDVLDADGLPATSEGSFKAAILRAPGRCPPNVTAALGTSGLGKSSALRGLASCLEVRKCFRDGVYYLSLGKYATEAKTTKELAKIVRWSGGRLVAREMRACKNIVMCIAMAIDWFSGKECLFMIHDLWRSNERRTGIFTLLTRLANNGSRNSAIAVTSRDYESDAVNQTVTFSPRDPLGPQSRDVLLRAAGYSEWNLQTSESRAAVQEILTGCKGVPLMQAIAGETVRRLSSEYPLQREQAWIHYLSLQNASLLSDNGYEARHSVRKLVSIVLEVLKDPDTEFHPDILSFLKMIHRLCGLSQSVTLMVDEYFLVTFAELQRLWYTETLEEVKQITSLFGRIRLMRVDICNAEAKAAQGVHIHRLVFEFAAHEVWEHDRNKN